SIAASLGAHPGHGRNAGNANPITGNGRNPAHRGTARTAPGLGARKHNTARRPVPGRTAIPPAATPHRPRGNLHRSWQGARRMTRHQETDDSTRVRADCNEPTTPTGSVTRSRRRWQVVLVRLTLAIAGGGLLYLSHAPRDLWWLAPLAFTCL